MTDRNAARLVGTLFLVATLAGVVGLSLQQPALDDPDYLGSATSQESLIATGVVLKLVMGLAVVGIAVVIFPVLARFSERLALGYLVARVVEAVVYVVSAVWLLSLVTLSGLYIGAGSPEGSSFEALGSMLVAQRDWAGHGVLDAAVFSVGALILNYALLRGRLVPAWLSGWGLVGAAAYLAAGVLVLYGLEPLSTTQIVLEAPLGLQELALALWLIIKGFSGSAVVSEPLRRAPAGVS